MSTFIHPATEDITLTSVLNALGDPVRLCIVKKLIQAKDGLSCSESSPCSTVPKSTLSHHFRVLREAGIVKTTKQGVEHHNIIRKADIEARFPKLLKTIIALAEDTED